MNAEFEKNVSRRILKLLAENQKLSQRDMARQTGVSLGKTNYCIGQLAKRGFVEIERLKKAIGGKQYQYIVTPAGVAEKADLTYRFLKKKLEEYDEIERQIRELRRDMETEREDLREPL